MASLPASVPLAIAAPEIEVAAMRAASCVRLNRYRPKLAPFDAATARAKSSAAPRDAPTTRISVEGEKRSRKAWASARRRAAETDSMTRNIKESLADRPSADARAP